MRASSSLCFNLRREAAPHATGSQIFCPFVFSIVSISDEKPLHMRHSPGRRRNRARKVSISDEKPLHMRQSDFGQWHYGGEEFQSQTRSRSTCDAKSTGLLWTRTTCFNLRREAAPHATLMK